MSRFLLVVVFVLAAMSARAGVPLVLDGNAVEGGLLFGHTAPNARVILDKKPIRVSEDGYFLLGFGRDSAGLKKLEVILGSQVLNRDIDVKDRNFKIERINGLPGKKVTPDPKALTRIKSEKSLMAKAKQKSDVMPGYLDGFGWPAIGRLSGVYGSQRILNGKLRRPHYGTDVAAPTGTPVRAIAGGRVAFVHPDMFFNGKTVLIDHGLGLRSVYIHMSAAKVAVGDRVAVGDIIGAIGATGRATGPHLHFGITLDSTPIDPEIVLGPMTQ